MPNPWMKSRRVRRDYSRKSFTNPLFSTGRERERGGRRWRRTLTVGAALAAFGGWVWFVAFSPTFRVTDIKIQGEQNIAEWEIRDTVNETLARRRWFVLPQSSLLIVPESAIVDALNERYVLESLDVTKMPPHTLVVTLKERVSAVLMPLPDGSQALIGLDGMVTRLYAASEALDAVPRLGPTKAEPDAPPKPPAYPVLYDDRSETFKLRDTAVRPEVVKAVIAMPKAMSDVFGSGPTLAQIHLDGAQSQTLRVVTSEGWAIYLNAGDDLQTQLSDAQTILKTKIGPDRHDLEYIDVRFGEKVFFKLRS